MAIVATTSGIWGYATTTSGTSGHRNQLKDCRFSNCCWFEVAEIPVRIPSGSPFNREGISYQATETRDALDPADGAQAARRPCRRQGESFGEQGEEDLAEFPLVGGRAHLISGATGLIAALSAGLPAWQVGPPLLIVVALLVAFLERRFPYDPSWNRDHDDTGTDVAHFVGNLLVSHSSLAAFAVARPLWRGADIWPSDWPLWVQASAGAQ